MISAKKKLIERNSEDVEEIKLVCKRWLENHSLLDHPDIAQTPELTFAGANDNKYRTNIPKKKQKLPLKGECILKYILQRGKNCCKELSLMMECSRLALSLE